MELKPEALRTIAAWLDLTDQFIHDVVSGTPIRKPILDFIAKVSEGDDMQADIRRWADEMEE